jgi:hypothetical protein
MPCYYRISPLVSYSRGVEPPFSSALEKGQARRDPLVKQGGVRRGVIILAKAGRPKHLNIGKKREEL